MKYDHMMEGAMRRLLLARYLISRPVILDQSDPYCVEVRVSSQVCLLKLFVERSTVRWRDEPWRHRLIDVMEPLAGFTGELWQRVMGPTMVGFMEPTGLMGNCIGWF